MPPSASPTIVRVAAVQTTATPDRDRNIATADRLVRDAARHGATFVVLPELFARFAPAAAVAESAETLDGPHCTWARGLAAELGITLVAGSFPEAVPGQPGRYRNTAPVAGPDGRLLAAYRKIHLFDTGVTGAQSRESDRVDAGATPVVVECDDGIRLGLAICYDVRFCELYRTLATAGADIVAQPTAFTERTGRDHYEVLVRARAIENATAMIVADQYGEIGANFRAYGRSLIVDAWGTVLAQAPDTECVVVADVDLAAQAAIRTRMPVLSQRRTAAAAEPAPAASTVEPS